MRTRKFPVKNDDAPALSSYTAQLTEEQAGALEILCQEKHWERREIAYARAAFRSDGLNIVLYESGKLLVQGKKTAEFVDFTLEPFILGAARMGYEEFEHPEWFESHAGLDESGKGDLFGPLVSACVIADGEAVRSWITAGVRDSKQITSDRLLFGLEEKIRRDPHVSCEVSRLIPATYNRLYPQFQSNLNQLLAWMHAQCLRKALARRPEIRWGLLDQFSRQPLVQRQLSLPNFRLKMQPRAEEDPVVAAASILARAEFIRSMKNLSQQAGTLLKRGAGSAVKAQAQELLLRHGPEKFSSLAKMHFKTAQEALMAVAEMDPYPEPKPAEGIEAAI
ncbi:MAG: ribonuclease HIII [Puniceicoccales bacterium]|jgi:ribonuclease HIII|nr:ribonuclease HIII [Puniceicoccales bacterium]